MRNNKLQIHNPNIGDIVVKKDETGVARAFEVTMTLKKGHDYVTIMGKNFITVTGMDRLNQAMGLSVLTPASVTIDGKMRPNPYIERDKNGLPVSVTIHKVAIGNTPMGQLVPVDYVLTYNRRSILMQSLAKVAQKSPAAVFLGTEDDDPNQETITIEQGTWKTSNAGKSYMAGEETTTGGKGRWKFYAVDENMGYWVNLSSFEVQEVMKDYVTILTTLERRAQSICTRNAMAHHPACGGAYAGADGKKTVYGIRYEQDPANIKKQLEDLASGKSIGDILDADVIEIEESNPEMAADEVMAVTDEVPAEVEGEEVEDGSDT